MIPGGPAHFSQFRKTEFGFLEILLMYNKVSYVHTFVNLVQSSFEYQNNSLVTPLSGSQSLLQNL